MTESPAKALQEPSADEASLLCHRCHEPITSQFYKVGEFAFHRDHFNCCVCEKVLHDSTDFRFKENDFYCLAHYEERFSHVCPGCQQKIIAGSGKVIKALGFYYHQNCFVCTTCRTQLSGKFFSVNGKPYCAEHAKQTHENEKSTPSAKPNRRAPNPARHGHQQSAGSVEVPGDPCALCTKPLTESEKVAIWGKQYHKHCLDCKYCHRSLYAAKVGEKVFFVKEGDGQVVNCERDYKIMMTKWCNACGEAIIGEMVYINKGEYYHQDCFKCKECGKQIENYLSIAGELRCSDHTSASNADVSCASCGQEIELNKIYPAVGKKFHKHCLKCSVCTKDLESAECKLLNGRLACSSCLLEHALATEPVTPASAPSETRLSKPGEEERNRSRSTDSNLRSSRDAKKLVPKGSADRKNKVLPSPGQKKHHDAPTVDPPGDDGKTSDIEPPSPSGTPRVSEAARTSEAATPIPEHSPKERTPPTVMTDDTDHEHEVHEKKSVQDLRKSSDSVPEAETKSPEDSSKKHGRNKSDAAHHNGRESAPGNASPLTMTSPKNALNKTMTPRRITNWKKGEMIGRGQFGKVFVGLLETGQWIAVKQMDIKSAEDEEHVKNMEKEVQLMEKLRHENIVSLLGTQRDGQHFYILMEFVPGKSLDVLLKNFGPFPEVTIRWYTLQLCRALQFMHEHGVVHRDIKGKNILVDTNGNLKIADFGSAKQVDNFKKDTPTLSYNYTPLWTAPEVVTQGNYDRKVDIWALGCVMIEMGTAKLPWHECKFENPFQILFHIGNAASHPELPTDVSEKCRDFMRKCLIKDPDQRPDASDLLNHEFLAQKDVLEEELEFEDDVVL